METPDTSGDGQGHIYMYKHADDCFRKIGRTSRTAAVRVLEQDGELVWFAKVKRNREAERRIFEELSHMRVNRICCDDEEVIFVKHQQVEIVFQSRSMRSQPADWAKRPREIEWFQFVAGEAELVDVAQRVIDSVNAAHEDEAWKMCLVEDMLVMANVFQLPGAFQSDAVDANEQDYLRSFQGFVSSEFVERLSLGPEALQLLSFYKCFLENWTNDCKLSKMADPAIISFPGHSCALVFDGAEVFVIPSRSAPLFPATNDVFGNKVPGCDAKQGPTERRPCGVLKTRIHVPSAAYGLKPGWRTESMQMFVDHLKKSESEIPMEERSIRSSVFVSEFLVAHMALSKLDDVATELVSVNLREEIYQECPEWSGRGVPWRRSRHYLQLKTVLRFLAARKFGSDGRYLYKMVKVSYCTWLMSKIKSAGVNAQSVECSLSNATLLLEMGKSVAHKVSRLDARALNVAKVCMSESEACLHWLDEQMSYDSKVQDARWTLPAIPKVERTQFDFRDNSVLTSDDLGMLCGSPGELGAFCPLPSMVTLASLTNWSKQASQRRISNLSSTFVLYMLEEMFFKCCSSGNKLVWDDSEPVESLMALVSELAAIQNGFAETVIKDAPCVSVEKHSRALLFQWTAAALCFAIARTANADLLCYWLPLKVSDLEKLLLREQREHSVRSMLFSLLLSEMGKPSLFVDVDATCDFAKKFGRENFRQQYDKLRDQMETNVVSFAERLREKKALAEKIRSEIRVAQHYDSSFWVLRDLQSQLQAAEKAPDPVRQPLPDTADNAFTVLFFMFMPKYLRNLSRVICFAGVVTHGAPGAVEELIDKRIQIGWRSDFNSASAIPSSVDPCMDGEVALVSSKKGLWHSHLKSTLTVHYPDLNYELAFVLRGEWVNPFVSRDTLIAWEKKLVHSKMQWSMSVPVDMTLAENFAICNQEEMADWMTPASFLTFSRLRAFPNSQIRSVLLLLQSNSISLRERDVRVLLQQTLRHCGPWEELTPLSRLWLSDLSDKTFCEEMFGVLLKCLEDAKDKVRDHEQLLALIDCGEWFASALPDGAGLPDAAAVLRQIAEIAQKWYQGTNEQLNAAASDARALDVVKSRRAGFASYVILALCAIPGVRLSSEDVCQILAYRAAFVVDCLIVEPSILASAKAILPEIESAMAARAEKIGELCDANILDFLAFPYVGKLNSQWTEMPSTFKAFSNHSVSLNPFSGTILINNLPIGMLPKAIREHGLFVRTFGDSQFSCVPADTGERLWTVSPIDDCKYSFALSNDELLIEEVRPGQTLRLVNPAMLTDVLPVYFTSSFGIWFDQNRREMLFRQVFFRGDSRSGGFHKNVSYVLAFDADRCSGRLFEIPPAFSSEDRFRAYLDDKSNNPSVVIPTQGEAGLDPLLNVLEKFDSREHVLLFVLRASPSVLSSVSFVNLRLSFVVSNAGELNCENYRNFSLASCQRISSSGVFIQKLFALGAFSQYLVLEPVAPSATLKALVISRVGRFSYSSVISDPDPCLSVCWEQDKFDRLSARSIIGRLQLALCYASCDSVWPVQGQMCAMGCSLQLVRSCWSDTPYNAEELQCLSMISKIAKKGKVRGRFALQLLCKFVTRRAQLQSVFYPQSKLVKTSVKAVLTEDYLREKRKCNEQLLLKQEEEHFLFGSTNMSAFVPKEIMSSFSGSYAAAILGQSDQISVLTREIDFKKMIYREQDVALRHCPDYAIWNYKDAPSLFFDWCVKAKTRNMSMESSWVMLTSHLAALEPLVDFFVCSDLCLIVHLVSVFAGSFQACHFEIVADAHSLGMCSDARMEIHQEEIFAFVDELLPIAEPSWKLTWQQRQDHVETERALQQKKKTDVYNALLRAKDLEARRPCNRGGSWNDFKECEEPNFFSADPATCLLDSVKANKRFRQACLANGLNAVLVCLGQCVQGLKGNEQTLNATVARKLPGSREERRPSVLTVEAPDEEWIATLLARVQQVIGQYDGGQSLAELKGEIENLRRQKDALYKQNLYSELGKINDQMVKLEGLLAASSFAQSSVPTFLQDRSGSVMMQEIRGQLSDSWTSYDDQRKMIVRPEGVNISGICDDIACNLRVRRERVEEAIDGILRSADEECVEKIGFAMQRRTNRCFCFPQISTLCEVVVFKSCKAVNPYIAPDCERNVVRLVKHRLMLLILETSIERLGKLTADELVVQELKSIVGFLQNEESDPSEWLILQLQLGILIRPVQRVIAHKIMEVDNVATIEAEVLQLNMGEGKTKVIVPMLCLHFAKQGGNHCLVLNVLSSQLPEVHEYLWNVLGDFHRRRIFHLPFSRDVLVEEHVGQRILECLQECKKTGGVLLVAPEHRLSLKLKWMELACSTNAEACAILSQVLKVPTIQLLDESDEILRHTYQLIYTEGAQQPLNCGSYRWTAVFDVLEILLSNSEVRKLLSNDPYNFVVQEPKKPGSFYCEFRVIGEDGFSKLRLEIARVFLKNSSSYFGNSLAVKDCEDLIRKYILCSDTDDDGAVTKDAIEASFSHVPIFATLLALRGLLSFDLLKICLAKRHRVEYGVHAKGGKLLAVPFRAKDAPSDRTEFGFPDMAIVLTTLHYYYQGLSVSQLQLTVERLFQASRTKQQVLYQTWYATSRSSMTDEDAKKIATVEVIDLAGQLHLLTKYYCFNRSCINFFLETIVFPKESIQFPHRIMANAWDLAECNKYIVGVRGFSGTRDSYRTLPSNVVQTQLPQLSSTDGLMMQRLTRKTIPFSTVKETELLDFVLKRDKELGGKKLTALIDCGAILCISNEQAVKYVLQKSLETNNKDRYVGGLFFNTSGRITFMDHFGCTRDFSSSPVRAADCFVLFDDAHSRGTDFVLGEEAHAVVTIGKGMNRDKLVQACMRMRKLNRGQTVEFVGTAEVDVKVRSLRVNASSEAPLTGIDLMHWVVENTAVSQEQALIEWARQGTFFHKKRKVIESMIANGVNHRLASLLREDELTSLKLTFGTSRAKMLACVAIDAHVVKTGQRLTSNTEADALGIMQSTIPEFDKIREVGGKYLSRVKVNGKSLEEECEKELEQQVEEEIQRVVPPAERPAKEEAFDPIKFFSSMHFRDQLSRLSNGSKSQLLRLASCLPRKFLQSHRQLRFSGNLVCTRNFATVLLDQTRANDLYLRPVSTVVCLSIDAVNYTVVLSGQEGDSLLGSVWKHSQSEIALRMFHFPLFSSRISLGFGDPKVFVADLHRVELRVFMGQCSFESKDRSILARVLGIVTPAMLAKEFANGLEVHENLRRKNVLSENGLVLHIPDVLEDEVRNFLQNVVEERCFEGRSAIEVVKKLTELHHNLLNFDSSDLHNALIGRGNAPWQDKIIVSRNKICPEGLLE